MVELHENHSSPDDQSTEDDARNSRNGLILFAVYVAIYGTFVALNTFAPALMGAPLVGLNLAIIYGFGLIIAALVLAAVYGFLCKTSAEPSVESPANGGGE